MKVVLLFPPQWSPTQPYLSIPSLTAFLRRKGYQVVQRDLNIEAYDYFLSSECIDFLREKSLSRMKQFEQRAQLSPEEKKAYKGLFRLQTRAREMGLLIDQAKRSLHGVDCLLRHEKLKGSIATLENGLELLSAYYFPTHLSLTSFFMRYSFSSINEVMEAIRDKQENPFLEFFSDETVPWLIAERPGLVGISISSVCQIIPALTLARLVKESIPFAHVTIGGNVFSRLIENVKRRENYSLFSLFDSLIVFEGETALHELVEAVSGGKPLSNIPNLLYKDGASIKGPHRIIKEDLDSLPTPDFAGLPLKKYFSPHTVLPLLTSRGCYWGKCRFCAENYGYRQNYRKRAVDLVLNDIEQLQLEHRVEYFVFVDEAITPRRLRDLSRRMVQRGLALSWMCDARFEKGFTPELCLTLSKAGCKMLSFGLESGSQRVLKLMEKGITIDVAKTVLRITSTMSIANHIYLLFGFPTETIEEAKMTAELVKQCKNYICSVTLSLFELPKYAPVYYHPAQYKIEVLSSEESQSLALWYDYRTREGMSTDEAKRIRDDIRKQLEDQIPVLKQYSFMDYTHRFLYQAKRLSLAIANPVE